MTPMTWREFNAPLCCDWCAGDVEDAGVGLCAACVMRAEAEEERAYEIRQAARALVAAHEPAAAGVL